MEPGAPHPTDPVYRSFIADLGSVSRKELFATAVQMTMTAIAQLAADDVNNIRVHEATADAGMFRVVLVGEKAE